MARIKGAKNTMETKDFNNHSAMPRYIYARNEVHPRAFRILKYNGAEARPVGDYMVLDSAEALTLSEKKVMNIVSALNGRDKLLQLGEETKSRQLFHLINDGANGEPVKVMFYAYKGEGCSTENALLTIERDEHVFH